MNYALITGASKGIGKAIARELARRKNNVLLIARSEDLLCKLEAEIRKEYDVEVHYKAVDLTDPKSASELADWCKSNDYEVNILVNNAGFGLWGTFGELQLEGQLDMMNLNMSALVSLTHYFLPILAKSKRSHILNVASMVSFLAVPHFSIYAATKAFVLSFSRSLRFDVAEMGIKVSCLCPGATESEFLKVAGMESVGDRAEGVYMSAKKVAEIGIMGMMKGKTEIVPGMVNKLAATGMWATPRTIVETIAGRFYKSRSRN